MTQIKIFNETTHEAYARNVDSLTKEINEFLAENDGKITIKDIKYTVSVQSQNPDLKVWTILLIYETC